MNTTVKDAFEIIELISKHQGELTLIDISKNLNMNKTKVFRHIKTLILLNIVTKQDNHYFLGLRFLELGSKVSIRNTLVKYIHPIIQKLANEINETVNLAHIYSDTALYIDKAESKRSLQLRASIGDKLPLYCTGLGKAILSILDKRTMETLIYQLKMNKMTKNTITDPDELMNQIAQIKEKSYSIDREEFEEGLICVAIPLSIKEFDFTGSISISGSTDRFNEGRIYFLVNKLTEAKNKIINALYHSKEGSND